MRSCWRLTVLRVIHATPQSEGGWHIGYSFLNPWPAGEVHEFLGQGGGCEGR